MLDIQRIDKRLTHLHASMQNLIHMSEMSSSLLSHHLAQRVAHEPRALEEPKQPEVKAAERAPSSNVTAPMDNFVLSCADFGARDPALGPGPMFGVPNYLSFYILGIFFYLDF